MFALSNMTLTAAHTGCGAALHPAVRCDQQLAAAARGPPPRVCPAAAGLQGVRPACPMVCARALRLPVACGCCCPCYLFVFRVCVSAMLDLSVLFSSMSLILSSLCLCVCFLLLCAGLRLCSRCRPCSHPPCNSAMACDGPDPAPRGPNCSYMCVCLCVSVCVCVPRVCVCVRVCAPRRCQFCFGKIARRYRVCLCECALCVFVFVRCLLDECHKRSQNHKSSYCSCITRIHLQMSIQILSHNPFLTHIPATPHDSLASTSTSTHPHLSPSTGQSVGHQAVQCRRDVRHARKRKVLPVEAAVSERGRRLDHIVLHTPCHS